MKIFDSSHAARKFCKKGTVITMGNYDGVHHGHRHILGELTKISKKIGKPSLVYTFDPHPVKKLAPSIAPPLINTRAQKAELLAGLGMKATVFEPFTTSFSQNSPEDFFNKFVVGHLRARFVIVGYDFTFGRERRGNIETLERLCFEKNITCQIMQAQLIGRVLVSSSLIRKYIMEGKVKEASHLLGRPYFIDGTIIKGNQRGRGMGLATANLHSQNELIPGSGVYVTEASIGTKKMLSVTNVGTCPTFGKKNQTIETHIPGLKKNLYRKKMRLHFLEKLREEKKFASIAQLKNQIQHDIAKAKNIF